MTRAEEAAVAVLVDAEATTLMPQAWAYLAVEEAFDGNEDA